MAYSVKISASLTAAEPDVSLRIFSRTAARSPPTHSRRAIAPYSPITSSANL
ncbi:MAG: hypothetical protein ACFB4J_16120 [Elainellaceae cyanobacterium]